MKVQERTIYRCDFCTKHYFSAKPAIKHEVFCLKNPANKHKCFWCKSLVVDKVKSDEGYPEKTFYCSKYGKEMHSVVAERIKHSCLGHTERMPIECEGYQIEDYFQEPDHD